MGELKQRITKALEERRKKVLSGGVNCIPLPFKRFRSEWPGIEQGKYYLVSGTLIKSKYFAYLFVQSENK